MAEPRRAHLRGRAIVGAGEEPTRSGELWLHVQMMGRALWRAWSRAWLGMVTCPRRELPSMQRNNAKKQ